MNVVIVLVPKVFCFYFNNKIYGCTMNFNVDMKYSDFLHICLYNITSI